MKAVLQGVIATALLTGLMIGAVSILAHAQTTVPLPPAVTGFPSATTSPGALPLGTKSGTLPGATTSCGGFGAQGCYVAVAPAPPAPSSGINLFGIEEDVLGAIGSAVLALLLWAIRQFAAKLGVEKNSALMDALDRRAESAVNAGIAMATKQIQDRGWDHIETRNAIIDSAATDMAQHAQTVLRQAGYDPSTPKGHEAIVQLVTRALPAATASGPPPPSPAAPIKS